MDNIELEFTDDAIKEVAHKASLLKTGARGLRSILEEIMQETMFKVPSLSDVEKVIISKETITVGESPRLIYKEKKEETA